MMVVDKLNSFVKTIIGDIFTVWYSELKNVFRDKGVVIFFFVVPFAYPLLYAFMYNSEVVREVPLLIVDNDRSASSREFVRRMDAAAEVQIAAYCADMEEAKELIRQHKAYGILLVPENFSRQIALGKQAHISLYSDMSSMLFYKAYLMTATEVSMQMSRKIQIRKLDNQTAEQVSRSLAPVNAQSVSIFNPQSGFASFLVPAILVLLLQQTLLLGVGMLTGTNRENMNSHFTLQFHNRRFLGTFRIVAGKALCYFMIYLFVSVWVLRGVPELFDFPTIGFPTDIVLFIIPYLLSAVFLAITLSGIVRDRETPMLLFVFTSMPLLFMSGVSWPQASIPEGWRWFSYLFPSTFGIQGFLKINTMGAGLHQVRTEYMALWVHTLVYFTTACFSYHYLITDKKKQ